DDHDLHSFPTRRSSDLSFIAGSLWFIPVEGSNKKIKELAQFSLVRVIRPMPKLRALRPMQRTGNISINCTLPTDQPLSSEPKVRSEEHTSELQSRENLV